MTDVSLSVLPLWKVAGEIKRDVGSGEQRKWRGETVIVAARDFHYALTMASDALSDSRTLEVRIKSLSPLLDSERTQIAVYVRPEDIPDA